MSVIVNNENFENEVLKSEVPVVIDFYADWCGPCKMMSPVLDEISDEMKNIKVVKINVDEAGTIAQDYNIMTIPAFVIVKDGQTKDMIVGAVPKELLIEKINGAL